ncbi:MAG: hypothetical protein JO332_03725 [Planctomycetaceae bacterium]|nr:hypothetical protein [Planctomycetaceae bacterium]
MEAMMALAGGPRPEDLQQMFMGMGFVASACVAGAASIVSLLGILYMTMVVAPNATQRLSGALRERNILSFFAGIPVVGFFGVTGAVVHRSPVLSGLNAVAFGVVLILAFAAAAEDIGRRLYWACGKDGSRASHLASGWLVFAFGALFPVLGWFVILPWVSLSGLGSVLVGLLPSRRAADSIKDIEYPEK